MFSLGEGIVHIEICPKKKYHSGRGLTSSYHLLCHLSWCSSLALNWASLHLTGLSVLALGTHCFLLLDSGNIFCMDPSSIANPVFRCRVSIYLVLIKDFGFYQTWMKIWCVSNIRSPRHSNNTGMFQYLTPTWLCWKIPHFVGKIAMSPRPTLQLNFLRGRTQPSGFQRFPKVPQNSEVWLGNCSFGGKKEPMAYESLKSSSS